MTLSKSLISRPFNIWLLPKVNAFQTSIYQTYMPNFMWIIAALLQLSSGQAHPFEKHVFGHVTSLIGWNVMTSYSEIFTRATAYTCQIWRESVSWLQSYCEKKKRIRRSRFSHIQTSVPRGTLNDIFNNWFLHILCWLHNYYCNKMKTGIPVYHSHNYVKSKGPGKISLF